MDNWQFWAERLAGNPVEAPDDALAAGYWINVSYLNIPNMAPPSKGGTKARARALVEYPVATWRSPETNNWLCRIDQLNRTVLLTDEISIQDLFMKICPNPIFYDVENPFSVPEGQHPYTYINRVADIMSWRGGTINTECEG